MLRAYQIPLLTEQMRAGTLRAAAAQAQPAPSIDDGATPHAGSPAYRLVQRLESLGYTVDLKPRAAEPARSAGQAQRPAR